MFTHPGRNSRRYSFVLGILVITVIAATRFAFGIDYVPGQLPKSEACEADIGDIMLRQGHSENLLWRGCLAVHQTSDYFKRYTTNRVSMSDTSTASCISCHDGKVAATFATLWTQFPRFNPVEGKTESFADAIRRELATRYGGTLPVRTDIIITTLYHYSFAKASQAGLSFSMDAAEDLVDPTLLDKENTTDSCRRVFKELGQPRGGNAAFIVRGCNLITDTHNRVPEPLKMWRSDVKCESCHREAGNRSYAGSLAQAAVILPYMKAALNKPIRFDRRVLMCFARSLNWIDIGEDSRILHYIRMYANWLAQKQDLKIGVLYEGRGIPMLVDTYGAGASILAGEQVFKQQCIHCHGENGWGGMGPVYNNMEPPPIAGPHSFNRTAATSGRTVIAGFAYNNMPPGASHDAPILTKQQALDVAIYLESLGRPADFAHSNNLTVFANYIWQNSLYALSKPFLSSEAE